jgi:hypothetical protein
MKAFIDFANSKWFFVVGAVASAAVGYGVVAGVLWHIGSFLPGVVAH